jgi:uncharacterized protein DUF6894
VKQKGTKDMPRYHFHFWNGNEFTPDPEGIELPSLEAAYHRACLAAKEMAGQLALTQGAIDARGFEIADESGRMMLALPFRDVMEVMGERPSLQQQSIDRWDDEGGAAAGPRERSQAPLGTRSCMGTFVRQTSS